MFKENPKHEIRNSKQILNHKSQIPNVLWFEKLVFKAYLGFRY